MRFLHAGAIYAAANVASAAVPFLLLPLLTRVLAPADYGHIVAFALLVTLCTPFAGLSVHSAVGVAWFNKSRDEIPVFNGMATGLNAVTTAILAPIVAFAPVMVLFTVLPFQNGAALANLDIGILFIVAVSSISSVGTFMAGWGSGNKFSLLGAMRAVAAIVSYEIPLVLGIVSVVLMSGTLSMNGIVLSQNIPYIIMQPLGFLVFFMAALAEINRSPFDLFEADQEIVAGYQTEYSGMRFAMFYLVEYAEAIAMSAIIATLFLGGWRGPMLPPWLWFIVKILIVFFVIVWVRTTVPRVRIDQLMALAWKFLLPIGLINLFITAIEVLVWKDGLSPVIIPINFAVTGILILIWSRFFKLGRGRVEV
jgi:NADH-quinone oxidoreductase subunit H